MGVFSKLLYGTKVDPYGNYDDILKVVKRGDLIEIKRTLIRHWVICEFIDDQGVVWCYHVSPLKPMGIMKVYVMRQPLSDILKGDLCRVNNHDVLAQTMGLTARPLDEIFAVLKALKDQKLDYELTGRNCEFYCTFWKYGRGWSVQVATQGWAGHILGVFGTIPIFGSVYAKISVYGIKQACKLNAYINLYDQKAKLQILSKLMEYLKGGDHYNDLDALSAYIKQL